VLDFNEDAYEQYFDLKHSKIRVGTMDLRIAAIVLVHNATLLTRNIRDFALVPGLKIEDWTKD
jgi:tRNA(fMet)-specific endonuclease VapC